MPVRPVATLLQQSRVVELLEYSFLAFNCNQRNKSLRFEVNIKPIFTQMHIYISIKTVIPTWAANTYRMNHTGFYFLGYTNLHVATQPKPSVYTKTVMAIKTLHGCQHFSLLKQNAVYFLSPSTCACYMSHPIVFLCAVYLTTQSVANTI